MSYLYKTKLNKIPNKPLTDKCIVLDLDETLVHSNLETIDELIELGIFSDPKLMDLRKRIYKITMDDVVHDKGYGDKTEMWGIVRPHVKEFLIMCFSYFKIVAVWSAGKNKYVHSIVDYLFKDIRRPHVIYTYDDCENINSTDKTLIKPLSKMINNVPGLDRYMSLDNTFIVDDRLSTFKSINPSNGILIPPYEPEFTIESMRKDDLALKQLINWLMHTRYENVEKLDKTHIFTSLDKHESTLTPM